MKITQHESGTTWKKYQQGMNARWEMSDIKKVRHQKSDLKITQYDKTTWKGADINKYNMKRVQHEKTATSMSEMGKNA